MNKKYEKKLERMQTASQEEMKKNMEKLFRENIDLKEEMKELKKLADEMSETLKISYHFTKSLADVAALLNDDVHDDIMQKHFIQPKNFNLTI